MIRPRGVQIHVQVLERIRDIGVVQLLRGVLVPIHQVRVRGSKLPWMHSIRENVRVFTLDHRYVARGFNAQQLGTHRLVPRGRQQIAVPVKHISHRNGSSAVVHIHQIQQPYDFARVVVHGRAGQQQQPQVVSVPHQFVQFGGHAGSLFGFLGFLGFIDFLVAAHVVNLVHNEQSVVELVLNGANGVLLGAAREPAHQIGQLNVPHEFVIGVDESRDAVNNAGTHHCSISLRQIHQFRIGAHLIQQLGSRAPANFKPTSDPVEFQLVEVKQLLAKIILHVDRRNHQNFLDRTHLLHVVPHLLGHAYCRTRFAGSEPMIQQHAVVRRHHGQKIAHKELMRGQLKCRPAQLGGFSLHLCLRGGNYYIVFGVVEFSSLCNAH